MGFSNPDSGCRRHPNHKQLPGVCSFCLRERLSKLSTHNNSYKTSNSTFSHDDSASNSPPERRINETHNSAPMGFVVHQGGRDVTGGSGLKKSRSVAWAPRNLRVHSNGNGNGNGNGEEEKRKEEKSNGKKGLWKKLIHSTSKKTRGVLMHSLSVKDRSSSHDNNFPRKF